MQTSPIVEAALTGAECEVARVLGRALDEEASVEGIVAAWVEVAPRALGVSALEVTLVGELTYRRRHGTGAMDVVRTWKAEGFEVTLGVAGREPSALRHALEATGSWLVRALDAVASRRRASAARANAIEAARVRRAAEALWLDLLATEPEPVFEIAPSGEAIARNAAARLLREDAHVMTQVSTASTTRVGERTLVRLPRRPPVLQDRVASCVTKWRLTARQSDVLERTLRGRNRREIAEELGCSEGAIDRHLSTIFLRANVRDRMELVLAVVGA